MAVQHQALPIVTGLQTFDQTNIPYTFNSNTGSPPTGFTYIDTSVRRDAGPSLSNMIIWGDNSQAAYATQRPAIKRSAMLHDTATLIGNDFKQELLDNNPEIFWEMGDFVDATGDAAANSGTGVVAAVYNATTTLMVDAPGLIPQEWDYAKLFGDDTTSVLTTTDSSTITQNTTAGFSFVCLFKPTADDISGVHVIMSRGARAAGVTVYTSGTLLIFQFGTGSQVVSGITLVAGNTYFVACRHAAGAGSQTATIDAGIVGGTIDNATLGSATRDTATAETGIGQIPAGTGTEDWSGTIDSVCFWDSDIGGTVVTALYALSHGGDVPAGTGTGRAVIRVADQEMVVTGAVISSLPKRAGGIPVTASAGATTFAKFPDGDNKVYTDRTDSGKVAFLIADGDVGFPSNDNMLIEYDNANGSAGTLTNHTHALVDTLGITLAGGFVYLNGRGYILTTSGDLYNSNEGDLGTWNALNVINAERDFDGGLFIHKHHDNIVVFGERSIEFFYDNGNPTASPLTRRQDIFYNIGLVGEVTKIEDTLYFVGVSEGSDFALYTCNNFTIKKISDERINSKIEALALGSRPLTLSGFSMEARHLIHIGQINTAKNSGSDTDFTAKENFIFDVKYGAMYDWSSADADLDPFIIDSAVSGGAMTVQGKLIQFQPVLASTAEDNPSSDSDDDGVPTAPVAITWAITSPNFTLGSHHRKFWREIGIEGTFGHRQSSADPVDIEISWSDDFYGTFNTTRTIDFSNYKFNVKAAGSSQQRAFKITSDTKAKVFLQKWIFSFSHGTH
tara:strand:- start:1394 stop:3760 length:2367 start_codon:yes stop_codon:yes gene_type:complete